MYQSVYFLLNTNKAKKQTSKKDKTTFDVCDAFLTAYKY